MKNSIYSSELILNMNTRLFINALDGVTDAQAKERVSGHSNPFIWIAAHNIWSRYKAINLLGNPVKDPYNDLFEGFRGYDISLKYPTLAEVKTEWKKASELLEQALANVTEEQLAQQTPPNPIGDFTHGGTIAFLAQHESYDIGQLAFLKKYHTREAMKY